MRRKELIVAHASLREVPVISCCQSSRTACCFDFEDGVIFPVSSASGTLAFEGGIILSCD